LLQDGQRREGIAAFGVERAQSMFDVERMIDQTEQMYESVLKEKR
jgi:glycosyltransferase involved in cell wall biosynthesis